MKIRIRRLLLPTLFCLAVACLIEIPLAQTTLFGDAVILWDTLFRAVIAVPVLLQLYREDRVFRGKERWSLKTAAAAAGAGIFAALLSQTLLRLTAASGYREAAEALFTGSIWLQAAVLLVASPLLEELFFRGILYQRLKELLPAAAAALTSAACFGLFHWNLPQGIYGFFMGLLLAYAMESCQTVKAPVLLHAAANGTALLLELCLNFLSKT